MKVFWTDTALSHLENIFDYYKSQVNLNVARSKTLKIVEKTILLEQSPQLGKIDELLKDRQFDYRFIVVEKYKIIYFIDKQQIVISVVFDCRQNPDKIKNIVK